MKSRIIDLFFLLLVIALLTRPGQRVVVGSAWWFLSTFMGEDGLYSAVLREYYCNNEHSCRHEQGHQDDHALGWFSQTPEFEATVNILENCDIPELYALNNHSGTNREIYADLYATTNREGFDNLADMLLDYAEQC
ncbi:MAG: hypothetical protein IH859_02125 [Chloroflexi bacterium]|nr:hypothetical protein [Chloroflexota bacterium]